MKQTALRATLVAVLCLGLVLVGQGPPARGAEVAAPTVLERIDGLPAAPRAAAAGEDVRRSEAVRAPIPFSLLGFAFPAGADVAFRTSADGESWSPWTAAEPLEAEHAPDPGTAEATRAAPAAGRSEPVWVGKASWVQVQVRGAGPTDVAVDVIDSLGLSRSLVGQAADALRAAWRGAAPAAAAPERPDIVSRAGWGADEALRSGTPDRASRVRMGVVHHTATRNDYTKEEAPGVVRGIYRYHTTSLGWDDIGYNLLVDRFGTVYEGRYGGLESGVVGAHVRGWNTGTFGVSLIGCFDTGACSGGGASLPEAARAALVDVLAWKFDVHHINVDATIDMNGERRRTLVGHRDVGETSCPGGLVHGVLEDLRRQVIDQQTAAGGVIVDPGAAPSSPYVRDGQLEQAITVSARLRPPAPWRLEIRDAEGQVVHDVEGSGETAVVAWQGGSAVRPGEHTYAVSSQGRRTAGGGITLRDCGGVFCDLDDTVHRDAILHLHAGGVVRGCTDWRYCPAGHTTRGQMASLLARALGFTARGGGHFSDVPDSHPHAPGINALYERGIVEGDGERFLPGEDVRRDQMATFVANSLDLSGGDGRFTDVDGNVHEDAINALAARDIARGDGDGHYHPHRPIKRDQAASLIDRALGHR